MARVRFEYDGGNLKRNLHTVSERIDRAVTVTVDRNAAWGQAWARLNAPWHDNTGAARGGLFAFPSSKGGHHEIHVTHTPHYGIWLEIANSGKYQIILPTIRQTGSHLMGDLKNLLGKL
jgi:hypothetical protein